MRNSALKIGSIVSALGLWLCAMPASAGVGCVFGQAGNGDGMGIVDSNATYWTALLPTQFAAGTIVTITARYPKVRFFNFTIYHSGKLIDHLPDTSLVPDQGGPANPNIAAIPYSNDYTDTYSITIRFEDIPAVRAPNTLYAGTDPKLQRLVMMRTYLPNPGSDITGDAGLPVLTQINPDGSTKAFADNSNLRCGLTATVSKLFFPIPLPILHVAPKNPSFTIVPPDTYNGSTLSHARYSNFDAGYGYVQTSTSRAPLVIFRSKTPAAPSSPTDPTQLQVRYFSVCEYKQSNRVVVACAADPDTVSQDDGYFNFVFSEDSTRPAWADTAHGYNWLPALPATAANFIVLRQVLPTPDFPGNYLLAGVTADPLATLGEWAPQVTYCDVDTFNANAPLGGATLFSACKTAYQQ